MTDHLPETLLKVSNLSLELKTSRTQLVKNVEFTLNKGQTTALVGESGSGKTLISLAIMQLLPPEITLSPHSTIAFKNEDLLTFNEIAMRKIRGRSIAIVFQEAITALNPVMTIGKQITEILKHHFKLTSDQAYQQVIHLLEEVGIPNPPHYYEAFPHQLSGGLKQRAMIAMALAGEPELLIADEPTTALDVTLQAQILDLLKDLQSKRGMSLLFITHDLGVVYQIADHVMVLYKGEVVESATAKVFFTSPTHPYSYKLFASLPGWIKLPERPRPLSSSELLRVEHLKVYYPIKKGIFKRCVGAIKAVDDVNLTLKEGSTLALVGESGSGKTTTGMAILRLTTITAGTVLLGGHDIAEMSQHELRTQRHDFQVIFQDPYASMNPQMMVGDIISEGIASRDLEPREIEAKIDDLLLSVSLPTHIKQRYPHEFSGGQRQRICIARALAMEPRLLICDEPTSALDVSAQMQVLSLLHQLQQQRGLSYLLITHNIAVVAYMADEVAVMHQGRIVEQGKVKDVLEHPQHDYTKKLLSTVPRVPIPKALKDKLTFDIKQ